jgi:glutamate racemase
MESQAYQQTIRSLRREALVFGQACPLFVPLAEEGWLSQPVTRLVAAEYLGSFRSHSIDTLILGCTHYPLLKPVIADLMGPEVTLIDSAEETARELRSLLIKADLMSHPSDRPLHSYFVSDVPRRFREVAERFLGKSIESVTRADLETLETQKETKP